MTARPETARWKILAPVELSSPTASDTIERALETADYLRAEVTLVSAVRSRPFGRWRSVPWPRAASGETRPHLTVHRLVLTGRPAEAIAGYADRTGANAIVLPPEYCVPRFFRGPSIAMQIAGLTARPMLTLPERRNTRTNTSWQRIVCLGRGDASDERILRVSEALAARCGAKVLTLSDARATRAGHHDLPDAVRSLISMVEQQSVGLLIAARPVYVTGEQRGRDLLALAGHLPCPLLAVPLISAQPYE